jgi:hypothetical protein
MGHTVTLSPAVDSMLREMDTIHDKKLTRDEQILAFSYAHDLYNKRISG